MCSSLLVKILPQEQSSQLTTAKGTQHVQALARFSLYVAAYASSFVSRFHLHLLFLSRYWQSLARDQHDFGTTIKAHDEASEVLIAPGCADVPIVL